MSGTAPNGIGQPSLTLTFTVNEWHVIRAGLYELPLKVSAQVAMKLEAMLQPQPTPAREATP